jgi:hypothetical protein
MAYDAAKDKVLDSRKVELGSSTSFLEVSLVEYGGGPRKIAIDRFSRRNDGTKQKMSTGRMLVEEAQEVAKAIEELLKSVKS